MSLLDFCHPWASLRSCPNTGSPAEFVIPGIGARKRDSWNHVLSGRAQNHTKDSPLTCHSEGLREEGCSPVAPAPSSSEPCVALPCQQNHTIVAILFSRSLLTTVLCPCPKLALTPVRATLMLARWLRRQAREGSVLPVPLFAHSCVLPLPLTTGKQGLLLAMGEGSQTEGLSR
jgi:hypothetical protein